MVPHVDVCVARFADTWFDDVDGTGPPSAFFFFLGSVSSFFFGVRRRGKTVDFEGEIDRIDRFRRSNRVRRLICDRSECFFEDFGAESRRLCMNSECFEVVRSGFGAFEGFGSELGEVSSSLDRFFFCCLPTFFLFFLKCGIFYLVFVLLFCF